MIPFLALTLLGHETTGGGLVEGVKYLVQTEPEKLNAWASWDAAEPALPWPLIFTGMFFNNLYWWCTNQSFVQRALAAKSLKEGQEGAIYCGFLKTIGFFYLVLPGVSLTTCRPFRTSLQQPAPPRSTSLIRRSSLRSFRSRSWASSQLLCSARSCPRSTRS